jgi:hypothetical protein
MTDGDSPSKAIGAIPPDDSSRNLTLVGPNEDAKLKHVALGAIFTHCF